MKNKNIFITAAAIFAFAIIGNAQASQQTEICTVTTGPAHGQTITVVMHSDFTATMSLTSSTGNSMDLSSVVWTQSGINSGFGGSSFSGTSGATSIILSVHPVDMQSLFKNEYGFYSEITSSGVVTSYVACSLTASS